MAITRIKNNQITDLTVNAASKLQDFSITSGKIANNLTYGSDFTITGNLTVNGTTTAVETTNLSVEDALLLFASGQTGSPTVDVGFIGGRGDEDNVAFVFDEDEDKFVAAFTTSTDTDTEIVVTSFADMEVANLDAVDANISGNIDITGDMSISGNVDSLDVTGNITGGNLITTGITETGSLTASTTIDATGNIDGGNLNTAGTTQTGSLSANTTITATGNISGSNITTAGVVDATGNIDGGNLNTAGTTQTDSLSANTTITATGNVSGGNITTAGVVDATGNVSGGNVNTAGVVDATGNVSGGNIITTGVTDTGSLTASTTIIATGNVSGGNLNTAGATQTGSLSANTTITATGNVSGSNLTTAGVVDATGNVSGGNINTTGIIDADGNINGDNINADTSVVTPNVQISSATVNEVFFTDANSQLRTDANLTFDTSNLELTGKLTVDNVIVDDNTITSPANVDVVVDNSGTGIFYVDRDTTVSGNLSVLGTTTTVNSTETTIEDPILQLGRGANNDPLTTSDGKDRGIAMYYFDAEEKVAFMGYDDPSDEWRFFVDATVTDEEVTGTLGDINVGGITTTSVDSSGNIDGTNINASGLVDATGNVSGGNLITTGVTDTGSLSASTTISATGNVSGGNLNTTGTTQTGDLSANTTITATGNVSGGNITTAGAVDATGNVSGGNIVTSGVTDTGSLTASTTVSATGNVSGGNITTAGVVDATGNVSGGNLVTTGETDTGSLTATTTITATGNVSGGNITTAGAVAATGNVSGGNITTAGAVDADTVSASTSVTSPTLTSTTDLNITSASNGNITLNPNGSGEVVLSDQAGDRMLFTTANSEISTSSNATFDGANLDITGSVTVDNVKVDGDEIQSSGSALLVNSTNGDVDFKVSGNAIGNLFVVDAGTDSMSMGSGNVVTGSLLTLDSTNSIVLPVGTTAERPDTPAEGMFRYNETRGDVEFYDGTEWIAAGTIFTVIDSETFSGDGSTTVFTLEEESTTAAAIVSINGVVQLPSTAYAISGTTLTFTEAPESGDNIEVRRLTTTTSVASLSNADSSVIIAASDLNEQFDVQGNLIPTANVTYNLGSDTARWNDLFLAGDSIILGDIVIKDGGSNTVAFFGSDGITPATLDSNNVDTTTISDGNSSVSIAATDGNVEVDVAGSSVATVASTGLVVTGSIEATNGFVGLDATTIEDGTSSVSVTSAGGDITANVGGSTVATFNSSGISAELTGNVTGDVTGQVSDISNHSTSDLSEGTNLYYTDARVDSHLSGGTGINFSSGVIDVDTSTIATRSYVDTEVANIVDSSPAALDTLNELASALGDDPNFATTIANDIGTKADESTTISAGSGLTGGGSLASNRTISHADTSSQASVNNSGGNVIQDISLDGFGHITDINSSNLDSRYLLDSGDTMSGDLNMGGNDITNAGTINGTATSAQYADLAENYVADAAYEPGTVVAFGGTEEVTVSDADGDSRIAGVISTNPAHLMNSHASGDHIAPLALQGRVPTRVTGIVRKGDMMVSNGDGTARAESSPSMGTVIGKALENFDGDTGVIEVVVGRL